MVSFFKQNYCEHESHGTGNLALNGFLGGNKLKMWKELCCTNIMSSKTLLSSHQQGPKGHRGSSGLPGEPVSIVIQCNKCSWILLFPASCIKKEHNGEYKGPPTSCHKNTANIRLKCFQTFLSVFKVKISLLVFRFYKVWTHTRFWQLAFCDVTKSTSSQLLCFAIPYLTLGRFHNSIGTLKCLSSELNFTG